jgi:hypothetical protein
MTTDKGMSRTTLRPSREEAQSFARRLRGYGCTDVVVRSKTHDDYDRQRVLWYVDYCEPVVHA